METIPSESPYRIFVEAMNEGAATIANDGTILYCNPYFRGLIGRSSDEILGKHVQTYIQREERPQLLQLLKGGGEESPRGEFHLLGSAGPIPILLSLASVKLDDFTGFCLVVTDLRERRQKEALSKDRQWLEKLLNIMPTAVLLFEKSTGVLQFANNAARTLTHDELPIGKSSHDIPNYVNLYTLDGRPLPADQYPSVRASRGESVRGQEVVWHGQEHSLVLNIEAEVLPQMHGRPDTIVLTMQDVTKLKAVEEDLARASRAKTEFLANMSHEIRTPLAAILGFTDLLGDPTIEAGEKASFVEVIARNGRQLANLVDDILDLSKIEAGRIEIERLEIALPRLVSEVIALFKPRAEAKGINLSLRLHEGISDVIFSDPTRLRQILTNLLSNAIKFTEDGGVTVEVWSERRPNFKSSMLHFLVRDTGIGIPPEQQRRLFQPFSQADASTTRRFGGTGLGLALSKKLAHALGGDLVLRECQPGYGCEFEFFIDTGEISEGLVVRKENLQAATKTAPAALPLTGLRVLLAEDSFDNQILIRRILAANGAQVESVENGEQAIRRALSEDFDVVLMDIQMPVVDGREAAIQLRKSGFSRPIVALTAHALKEEVQKSLAAGFNDHLTKPITRTSLISTLARFLPRETKAQGKSRSLH